MIETGVLWRDDNLPRLADRCTFPDESVDLVYLDPPFFSNRSYEVIWGDEAEVRSFEDRWEGGIRHYVKWMEDRLVEMHRLLKPTGSLYLHCDPHASHYLKVMLDGIFGYERFRNEVIWRRTAAKGGQMGRLPANHDVILLYTKTPAATWNEIRVPYDLADLDEKTLSKYAGQDTEGRRYQLTSLLHPEQGRRPNLEYDLMGVRRTWRWSRDRMERAVEEGRIVQPGPGRVPRYKRYLDEQPGRLIDDVWIDINPLNSRARERLEVGYPTQKPEALLERIILASSNPDEVVLDPFCGCGTTVAAAERLNRQWIGVDISPTAIEVMRRRMWRQHRIVPDIRNSPETEEDLKALRPFEFQNWIVNAIGGYHSPRHVGDMGIDGYTFFRREPIQVKQSEHVGRNVVDNFETAVRRAGHDTGHIIAFSFTRGAYEEVARARSEGLDISLVKVAQVLLQVRRPSGRLAEKLGISADLPITPMPKREDMRSAEELVESDLKAVG